MRNRNLESSRHRSAQREYFPRPSPSQCAVSSGNSSPTSSSFKRGTSSLVRVGPVKHGFNIVILIAAMAGRHPTRSSNRVEHWLIRPCLRTRMTTTRSWSRRTSTRVPFWRRNTVGLSGLYALSLMDPVPYRVLPHRQRICRAFGPNANSATSKLTLRAI